MSLDGSVAAPGDGPGRGLGRGGQTKHAWLEAVGVAPGSHRPDGGVDSRGLDEMMATGAVITGRRTWDHAARVAGAGPRLRQRPTSSKGLRRAATAAGSST